LNHPPSQPCQELDDAASTTLPDADIPDNAPSLDEVQRAIRRLRNGRAAEADDISPELLKCAGVYTGRVERRYRAVTIQGERIPV